MNSQAAGKASINNKLTLVFVSILVVSILALSWAWCPTPAQNLSNSTAPLAVKPYVQLGNNPPAVGKSSSAKLEIVWMAHSRTTSANGSDKWLLEVQDSNGNWQPQREPLTAIAERTVPLPLTIFRVQVDSADDHNSTNNLLHYRIKKNGQPIFASTCKALKKAGEPCRVVVTGDIGANTPAQRKIAFEAYKLNPDVLVLAGDIVYDFGLLSDYLEKLFPIYNCDKAAPDAGAPLLRSTPTVTALGNHDIALGAGPKGIDLNKFSDALAYFKVWSEPLNGPSSIKEGRNSPKLIGNRRDVREYWQSTQGRYPIMANYSFNCGDAHWLFLDANQYMDWTNSSLRQWVANDLSQASNATWRFVCFHQPGFSFDMAHSKEQRMRLLCDVFEQGRVDVVFSGHAHNYQRSYPLYFKAMQKNGHFATNADGTIDGELILDKSFDGIKNTSPHGIIYIVSGAGGARLYGPITDKVPSTPRTFTDKFISNTHSLTVCDVTGEKLSISQIAENGDVIDRILLTKSPKRKGE